MARITQQFVKNLVTETHIAKLVYDDEVPGFCVRVTPRVGGDAAATYAFDYLFQTRQAQTHHRKVYSVVCRSCAQEGTGISNDDRQQGQRSRPLKAHDEWKSEPTCSRS